MRQHSQVQIPNQMRRNNAEENLRAVDGIGETADHLDVIWQNEPRKVYVVNAGLPQPIGQVRLVNPEADPPEARRKHQSQRRAPASTPYNR